MQSQAITSLNIHISFHPYHSPRISRTQANTISIATPYYTQYPSAQKLQRPQRPPLAPSQPSYKNQLPRRNRMHPPLLPYLSSRVRRPVKKQTQPLSPRPSKKNLHPEFLDSCSAAAAAPPARRIFSVKGRAERALAPRKKRRNKKEARSKKSERGKEKRRGEEEEGNKKELGSFRSGISIGRWRRQSRELASATENPVIYVARARPPQCGKSKKGRKKKRRRR